MILIHHDCLCGPAAVSALNDYFYLLYITIQTSQVWLQVVEENSIEEECMAAGQFGHKLQRIVSHRKCNKSTNYNYETMKQLP